MFFDCHTVKFGNFQVPAVFLRAISFSCLYASVTRSGCLVSTILSPTAKCIYSCLIVAVVEAIMSLSEVKSEDNDECLPESLLSPAHNDEEAATSRSGLSSAESNSPPLTSRIGPHTKHILDCLGLQDIWAEKELQDKRSHEQNINVICRFRPESQEELEHTAKKRSNKTQEDGAEQKSHVQFNDENPGFVQISVGQNIGFNKHIYYFDRVFQPSATQHELYNFVGKDCVQKVLDGFNACILAYGQTGR